MTNAARRTGITTTTDGFDESLLTAMADSGGGNAHCASGPDEAPAIFASEFDGLANLAAHDVSLEIRPTEEVQLIGCSMRTRRSTCPAVCRIQAQ